MYEDIGRSLGTDYFGIADQLTREELGPSSFMRLKLHGQLASRGVAPHIYESRDEALRRLDDGASHA